MNVLYSIVSALVGLGILIVIHELGHFLVAKKTGVGVFTFSIGFGPKLFKRKVGETEYALSALPFGGYVKMVGEDPEEEVKQEDLQRSFSHQGLFKRIAIVAAGPFSNLLLAFVIFLFIAMVYGIGVQTTGVGGVEAGSPAAQAGLQKGDKILAINGRAIKSWEELSDQIKGSRGQPLVLRVQRGSQELQVTVKPALREGKNLFQEKTENWMIGIASEILTEKGNPLSSLQEAFKRTYDLSKFTLQALYKMISGDVSPKNLGGPLLIAQMAGQQAREGLASFLAFLAVLSVNLGVLNFLPIPVLDGGHLFFFLIEGILGRPLELKHRERAQQVGVFILILVMIYAFYNDITRFFQG